MKMLGKLTEKDVFLLFVDRLNRLQHLHVIAVLLRCLDKRFHILREATTTISTTRIEKFISDTTVRTDSLAHHIDIGTYQLTKIGNIVHTADAGCQHGIGCIFGHLGRGYIHENHTEIIEHHRLVELGHQLFGLFALHTHHHTVGLHKIINGIAFLEEFRIACYIERHLYTPFIQFCLNGSLYFLGGSYRHCTLSDHHNIMIDMLANGFCHFQHITQISTAVFVRRRSDR